MAERAEGHGRATGDGPEPVLAAAGIAAEGRSQAAYRAYVEHMRGCGECPQSLFQCEAAAVLWREYRAIRGVRGDVDQGQ